MTRIKLCGLTREQDISCVNTLIPDYIGFVFAKKSRRYIMPEEARKLKRALFPGIQTVGVFVNEAPEQVARLLNLGIIDIAQLHGSEDERYLRQLRQLTNRPVFQAFRIDKIEDVEKALNSTADMILLDSGNGGTGTCFDWELIRDIKRPYFLAGGLSPENIEEALKVCDPYGVDVSSGIETNGLKDRKKMTGFVNAVRSYR